jgi:hypothetical protein
MFDTLHAGNARVTVGCTRPLQAVKSLSGALRRNPEGCRLSKLQSGVTLIVSDSARRWRLESGRLLLLEVLMSLTSAVFCSRQSVRYIESKMIATIRSTSVLILLVTAAILGTAQAQCVNNPADCTTCLACDLIVRQSDKQEIYMWIAADSSSTTPGAGTCVHRFDPPITGTLRNFGAPPLCGNRIFTSCSGGLTQSVMRSCPIGSPASELKISSVIIASLVAVSAICLM